MTLQPAYGRDYKSQKEVKADWDANKDFIIADVFHGGGTYINKEDAKNNGIHSVNIRFSQNRKVCVIKL